MSNAIKEKMTIFVRPDSENENGFKVMAVNDVHKFWMTDEDINVGVATVEYDLPEDMTNQSLALKSIATLKERQDKVRADAYVKIQNMEEKIATLMMITDQSGGLVDVTPFDRNYDDEIPF